MAVVVCACGVGCARLVSGTSDADDLATYLTTVADPALDPATDETPEIRLVEHAEPVETPDDGPEPDHAIEGDHENDQEAVIPVSDALSLEEVVAQARLRHPRVIAAKRLIDQAESQVRLAASRQNPEFVLDLDTPVHDDQDATELSTRLTFPIGQTPAIRLRVRAARAEVARADASYQQTLRSVIDDALSAAIDLSFLEARAELDRQAYQLALRRHALLAPGRNSGDAAENLVDHVNAANAVRQAAQDRFTSRRRLSLARNRLAEAIGMDPQTELEEVQTLSVESLLGECSASLPPLRDVIDAAIGASEELLAADWATRRGWIEHQQARLSPLSMEMGPRYQDRLGRNDDTVGVRFQSDLPIHDDGRAGVAATSINAQLLEDQSRLKRHQIIHALARDYRELESIAAQLEHDRVDSIVAELERVLRAQDTQDVLTGQQVLRIEQAILDHRRDQLDLEYRCAVLRSKLRLDATGGEAY
ncbi:Outer membrane efflux protein [Stieleria maiorica]|uniref:Outer membrane efflux protein n=1 Tax=Stieleria maiorica TaxID=2795974 RepID=A0A5B9MK89_9BACT|nr:Outer membrane efflux protein [Stieleria maiorica]